MSHCGHRVVVVASLLALGGVMLGGSLTSRSQAKAWLRDDQRQLKDTRRDTYGRFLSAVRQYVAYGRRRASRG
jgi:hypothetical protein